MKKHLMPLLILAFLLTACGASISNDALIDISTADHAFLVPNNAIINKADGSIELKPNDYSTYQIKVAQARFDPNQNSLITFSRIPYIHQWEMPILSIDVYVPSPTGEKPIYKITNDDGNLSQVFEYSGGYLLSQITIGAKIIRPDLYLNEQRFLILNKQNSYSPANIDEFTKLNIYQFARVKIAQKVARMSQDEINQSYQNISDQVKSELITEFGQKGVEIQLFDLLLAFPPK